jgi:hypothetical protein
MQEIYGASGYFLKGFLSKNKNHFLSFHPYYLLKKKKKKGLSS